MGIIVQSVLGVILFAQMKIRCDGNVDTSIVEMFEADSEGGLYLNGGTSQPWPSIRVKSLPINSLKHLILWGVNLIWEETEPIFLEHLQEIQLYNCKVNPHSILFSDNLKSLEFLESEIVNGTLGDLLKTANNLQSLTTTADSSVIRNQNRPNINVKSLPINLLNKLVLGGVNLIWNAIEPILLEHLQVISLDFCKVNPHSLLFSDYLKSFEIWKTEIINGTLGDLLKTATNIQSLSISTTDENDISELLPNHSAEQSPHSNTFFPKLVFLQLRNTALKNTRISDILNVSVNLKKLIIISSGGIDVSRINSNHSNYLNATEVYFGKKMVEMILKNTTFVNGDLNSFFKFTANLEELDLEWMDDVDISMMPSSSLRSLELWDCNLKWTRKVRFEKLTYIFASRSSVTDMKPFLEFNEWFPHVTTIDIGAKIIVPPKAIFAMMNSSLTTMKFSFDCNPPIKSYEFGKVMKFMLRAGFIHNDDAGVFKVEAEKSGWNEVKNDLSGSDWKQRIHYVRFQKLEFGNGSFEWIFTNDYTFVEVLNPTQLDIKSVQTKSLIYIYFVLVSTLLCFGITGNSLSSFVLLVRKPKNSAGIILLGLTFFDFLVTVTYVITAILNAQLFHDLFLKTGLKSARYSVDEHLWMTEQNFFQTFILYSLNKTAYTGSVYTTILISLERFIAICWPLKSKQLLCSRNSKLAILTISVFSVLLNLPRWIESHEWNYYSDESPYWNDYYKPTLMRMETYRIVYHGWIWSIFMYIHPFVLVGFFNFKILRHLKHTKQERRSLQSTGSNTTERKTKEDAEMMSVTKMLLCVVGVFVVCNSLHIAIVFYFIKNYEEIQLSTIEAVSCLPIIVNCSVNFIIYIYFGKTLRAEFLKLVPRWVYSSLSCCKKRQPTNIGLPVIGQEDT